MTLSNNQQTDNYKDDIENSQPKKLLKCETKGRFEFVFGDFSNAKI